MAKQGEGGAQLVFLERLADQRGCPKLRGNGRAFVVARHEDERNVARLEDCGDGKTQSFMELHVQQGAVERAFSGQLTSLRQPADRTDRLQAAVLQEIADQFGQQVAVFDDEDLLAVPRPVVTRASAVAFVRSLSFSRSSRTSSRPSACVMPGPNKMSASGDPPLTPTMSR